MAWRRGWASCNRFAALHSGAPDEHVLNGVVQHVSHVQHTRDVGWRNDDAERLLFRIWFRMKITFLHPVGVPLAFDFRGIVFGG